MSIPTPEKRIADFENLGFGMFIHWGLYSQVGKGEWIQSIQKVPKEEYQKLQETFTASKFDARHIVSVAKAAGARRPLVWGNPVPLLQSLLTAAQPLEETYE